MDIEETFAKALQENPKLLEQLSRRAEMDEFKEKYNTERASPLKCPACSQWGQTGGSLWIKRETTNKFVCRKCKLEWTIDCETVPNSSLFIQIRKVQKGE